jgi:hypothetical protein
MTNQCKDEEIPTVHSMMETCQGNPFLRGGEPQRQLINQASISTPISECMSGMNGGDDLFEIYGGMSSALCALSALTRLLTAV